MSQPLPSEMSLAHVLTAGETDAQGRMPLWLIASRIIEAATLHADSLGVGYADLLPLGIGWVLSRLSVSVQRYLVINEHYTVTTWIEGYNRLYSDRCFLISDAEGLPVVHARSMWVAIDFDKRTPADLTALDTERFVVSERRCPLPRIPKPQPLPMQAEVRDYKWMFSDIDFNHHVNTVQYIRHILNQWDMERYAQSSIEKFSISFLHECHYGDTAQFRHADVDESLSLCEIVDPLERKAVMASISWSRRPLSDA